jgi:hypothetical protein
VDGLQLLLHGRGPLLGVDVVLEHQCQVPLDGVKLGLV